MYGIYTETEVVKSLKQYINIPPEREILLERIIRDLDQRATDSITGLKNLAKDETLTIEEKVMLAAGIGQKTGKLDLSDKIMSTIVKEVGVDLKRLFTEG